ncbi:MAG TPA: MBL fold metallo-hydrolase [Chloroflexota bacterium]|jgi:glyoxylase-like metal-dependent hydrolase (beta-lactamase superfamily II)|nr:MBL fold metallo-hydrolase [Chloroflexota bacterium]
MTPEQPVNNIYRIEVPTPYPVGPVNCYLLDGPEPALVDCGPATTGAEAALRAGLAAIGLQPRDIARIVLTHHHPDHAGGLSWLTRETGAPVAGHRFNDLWLLDHPAVAAQRLAFFVELYRYCGVEGGDLAAEFHRRFDQYGTAPRAIDAALAEGNDVDLAGTRWQVLETPGHAGTHIGLLRADGTLLAGDTLLERISSNALVEPPYPGQHGRAPSLLAYRHTLQRLANLPLQVILPGHGNTFTGAAPLIARRLKAQEERAHRLLAQLQTGRDTVLALCEALFPGLQAEQLFLGLSEVLGHLDLLEEMALARHEGSTPARYHAL